MSVEALLPPSWLECSLGDVIDYGRTNKAEPQEIPADAWVLELEDVEKDTSRVLHRATYAERRSKSTKNRFKPGDVLYGKLRPYLNKVVRATEGGFCTTEIIPLTPTAELDGNYLFYWLRHPRFLKYVTSVSHGLNMPRLGTDAGKAAPFVLAPLPEQKRIADKLDALIAGVDACRERLDRVQDVLKRFRQAVLAAAATGELTREWREERGLTRAAWRRTTFETICSEITVGFVGKMADQYRPDGVPFLRSQNVRPFRFDPRELRYVSSEFHRSIAKSTLRPGDVVVVRTGAPGQCCVIPAELKEANCSDLVIVRPGPELDSDFAVVFINSETSQSFVKSEQVGVAQSHFNVGSMKRSPIELPPVAEQREIARRVRTLFDLAIQLEERTSKARGVTDTLTRAALAKAFRGELVPQDPTDEPASALLAKLKTEQANAAAEPSRRRPKTPGKRPTMSDTDKDSIKAAILKLKTDRFSFDELRAQVSGDYESLRAALFELLEEPSPVIRQVFDKKAKAMQLVRVRP